MSAYYAEPIRKPAPTYLNASTTRHKRDGSPYLIPCRPLRPMEFGWVIQTIIKQDDGGTVWHETWFRTKQSAYRWFTETA